MENVKNIEFIRENTFWKNDEGVLKSNVSTEAEE